MGKRVQYDFKRIEELESGVGDNPLSRTQIAALLGLCRNSMLSWLSRNCTRTVKVEYKLKDAK